LNLREYALTKHQETKLDREALSTHVTPEIISLPSFFLNNFKKQGPEQELH